MEHDGNNIIYLHVSMLKEHGAWTCAFIELCKLILKHLSLICPWPDAV